MGFHLVGTCSLCNFKNTLESQRSLGQTFVLKEFVAFTRFSETQCFSSCSLSLDKCLDLEGSVES